MVVSVTGPSTCKNLATSGAMLRAYMECASRLPMPFVCVSTSSRCCVAAWRRPGWAIRRNMRHALQRSLLAPGLTITLHAWSCGRRPGPIRDGVCQASPRGARRSVGRTVKPPVRTLRAPRSLRHIAEVSSRGVACSCSRWDVGCATHTRGAGVHPAVVQGAVDILQRTFPNRR